MCIVEQTSSKDCWLQSFRSLVIRKNWLQIISCLVTWKFNYQTYYVQKKLSIIKRSTGRLTFMQILSGIYFVKKTCQFCIISKSGNLQLTKTLSKANSSRWLKILTSKDIINWVEWRRPSNSLALRSIGKRLNEQWSSQKPIVKFTKDGVYKRPVLTFFFCRFQPIIGWEYTCPAGGSLFK